MRRISLLIILTALLPWISWAQQRTPEQSGGIYYAYPVKQAARIDIPDSLHLFYISHYGRHGSRWIDRKERYRWTRRQFADSQDLTPAGLVTKEKVRLICRNAKGKAGKLTELGREQHRQIAARMAANYPEVFRAADAAVTAQSSTSPRCRASMLAFCKELTHLIPHLKIRPQTKKRFMAYINFESEQVRELRRKTPVFPQYPTARFVESLFKEPNKVENPQRLLYEIHTMASDMQDIPLDISLWDCLTNEEMAAVHDANDSRMVIYNGRYPGDQDIPARSALSLWNHIQTTADGYINSGKTGASLLFGHDSALYRLLSLLRLSLPGDGMEDIIPMAANLQLLFARGDSGNVYVAFLHNEHLQYLPIKNVIPGFYSWNDVKNFIE